MIKLTINHGYYNINQPLFKNATLHIKFNKINIISGDNGCGKTTLLNLLCQLHNKNFSSNFNLHYKNKLYYNDVPKNLIANMGFLFQNISELCNPLYQINQQIKIETINPYLAKLFDIYSLPLNKYPYEYSLGQLQKILLSLILSQAKDFILLDEPTANLDSNAIKKLIQYLLRLNKTILITTHNMDFASQLNANHMVIQGANVITQTIKSTTIKDNNDNLLDKTLSNPLISIHNYQIAIGKVALITKFNWQIYKNHINIITGGNGCGKTTLAMAIYHTLIGYKKIPYYTQEGDITCNTPNLGDNNVSFISQDYYQSLAFNCTAMDLVLDILKSLFKKNSKFTNYRHILSKLKLMGLSKPILSLKLNELSFGNKQKIAIFLSLISNPKLIIMDEITSSQDHQSHLFLMQVLEKFTKQGITILLITHSTYLINHFNKNIINLDNKNIDHII